jgi:hypothetical protein
MRAMARKVRVHEREGWAKAEGLGARRVLELEHPSPIQQ